MAVSVDRVSLMTDKFTRRLGWDDIIGVASDDINIEIEASGVQQSLALRVEVTSRLPNGATGPATIVAAVRWDVPPAGSPGLKPGQALFRLTKKVTDAGPFVDQHSDSDVATVVRDGGTSDANFRSALGWTARGVGKQPTTAGASTGSEAGDVPDARSLLLAAGAEVLQFAVPPDPKWTVSAAPARRLVRKPCRVVYYSGHGLSGNNCLGIETAPHKYACWADSGDLVKTWTTPACRNLDYFVIAGCSLLRYRPAPGAPARETIGLNWARLLATKGGPLVALLGYADSAPSDQSAGDALATELGTRIAAGKAGHDLVVEWLSINGIRKCWNAVAMDSQGYWWIEPRRGLLGFSENFVAAKDIKGPRAIP